MWKPDWMTTIFPDLMSDSEEEDNRGRLDFMTGANHPPPNPYTKEERMKIIEEDHERLRQAEKLKRANELYNLPGGVDDSLSPEPKKSGYSLYSALNSSPTGEGIRSFYSSLMPQEPSTSHASFSLQIPREQRNEEREKALNFCLTVEREEPETFEDDDFGEKRAAKRFKHCDDIVDDDFGEADFMDTCTSPSAPSRSKRKTNVCVQGLFSKDQHKIVEETVRILGGTIVEDIEEATHFVAKQPSLTTSYVCAIARHIPVVSLKWVDESKNLRRFAPTDEYILRDQKFDAKWKMTSNKILEEPLLQDWNVACSYSEKAPSSLVGQNHFIPGPEEIAKLTRCCGGTYSELESLCVTKTKNYNLLVVRCLKHQTDEEKRTIADVKKRGINFMDVSTFFVCCGRQSKKAFQSSLNKCR